jgi:hypothetical protein
MSCVFSLQTQRSVILLTDGAVYNQDGVLRAVKRKVDFSERVPVAVATRGSVPMGDIARECIIELVELLGFDEAMDVLARRAMPDYALFPNGSNAFEVLIAGVSEAHGPRHLFFQNVENFGLPALELLHPGADFWGGSAAGEESVHDLGIRRPRPGEGIENFMAAVGADIMEPSRKRVWTGPNPWNLTEGARHIVGGHCDMTVVSASGVTVQRLRTWDDKIGGKVDPFAAQGTVVPITPAPPLPGLNRQQRRAAERQRRRKVA